VLPLRCLLRCRCAACCAAAATATIAALPPRVLHFPPKPYEGGKIEYI
jgi:hypothetical protein